MDTMDTVKKKRRLNEEVVRPDQHSIDSKLNDFADRISIGFNDEENDNFDAATADGHNVHVEPSTRIIQEAYALSNTLNESTRRVLIENIADSYLNEGVLLPTCKIRSIAEEICSAFRDEDMVVYYIDPVGGRLYNRYHSKLKEMRKANLFPKSTRAINKILRSKETRQIYVLDEKEKKSLEYLRRMDFKNFHEIVEHWRITFAYRKDIFEDSEKDIEQILGDQWKPLKSSHGHILICEDFKIMYGIDKAASLRLRWQNIFHAGNLEFLKEKVKNRPTLRMVEHLPLTSEYVNVSTIYLLNAILLPPLQNGRKRATIQDAQDAVLLSAKTDSEIHEKLEDKFQGIVHRHPIIVAVGSKDEQIHFWVVFHIFKYRFHRFCDALDVCFKIFCVFHIDFPKNCSQFYAFLNEMFYNVNLNIGKSAKVAQLVHDFKTILKT